MAIDTSSTVSLPAFYGKSCDWYDIPCHATSMVEWAQKFFVWLPSKVFETICNGLAALIEAIPVPAWVSSAGTNLGAIPPGVVFFADAFKIGPGLTIILGAYVIRFAIRRIPLIG